MIEGFVAGFIFMSVDIPHLLILLTVDPFAVGCSTNAISVISVNGWHELLESHSYRCDMYVCAGSLSTPCQP